MNLRNSSVLMNFQKILVHLYCFIKTGVFMFLRMPVFLGNEMGEPVIEEREIRISDKPIKARGDALFSTYICVVFVGEMC